MGRTRVGLVTASPFTALPNPLVHGVDQMSLRPQGLLPSGLSGGFQEGAVMNKTFCWQSEQQNFFCETA